jgi:hypothetical protein
VKNFVFLAVLVLGGLLCRVNLPEASLDSILASSENTGTASKAVLKTAHALGIIKVAFSDLGIVRFSTLDAGETHMSLIGIPFLGWYRV